MAKNYKILATLLTIISSSWLNGQILNIDRENGQDTMNKRFHASFDFNFALDKQKGDFIDFNNKTELDLAIKKRMILIFLNSTEISFSGSNAIENNGYFQLRFRDNDKRKVFADSYAQYQYNGILGMKQRFLVGSNVRINWMEKKKSDLYTSFGIFYEDELWDPGFSTLDFADSVGIIHRQFFRFNSSIKTAFKLGNKVDFASISYVQFPLNEFYYKPRWFFDSNLNIAFNKRWSMQIHYDHNYDLYRALPIDAFYYSLTIGVKLQI